MKAGSKHSCCFHLVFCLTYSLTLKMEAICVSETSVIYRWTTWRYILEGRILHNYCFERPVTVAEQSTACTVFAVLEARTVGSNHTQGMDV
jgi:hypothetical protein